ncbi:hypothetical protein C8J57DRAFT_1728451, partial [Mycena rebaudengoi]
MCSSPPFLVTLSSSWSSIRASPQRHKALKRPQSIQAPDPQARNPFLLAVDLLKPLSQSAHQAWCHPIGIQERNLKLRYIPQASNRPADSKRSTDDCAAFYINTDTRIQILDSMDHLPQAEKEQCDAFLRDERMLRLVGRILLPSSRLQGEAHEAQLAPQKPPLQPTPGSSCPRLWRRAPPCPTSCEHRRFHLHLRGCIIVVIVILHRILFEY